MTVASGFTVAAEPGRADVGTSGLDLALPNGQTLLKDLDLVLPKGVDFAAREVYDGISMSLVRDFSISDRSFPCRVDVLYGYKTVRPQLAVRLHADG